MRAHIALLGDKSLGLLDRRLKNGNNGSIAEVYLVNIPSIIIGKLCFIGKEGIVHPAHSDETALAKMEITLLYLERTFNSIASVESYRSSISYVVVPLGVSATAQIDTCSKIVIVLQPTHVILSFACILEVKYACHRGSECSTEGRVIECLAV